MNMQGKAFCCHLSKLTNTETYCRDSSSPVSCKDVRSIHTSARVTLPFPNTIENTQVVFKVLIPMGGKRYQWESIRCNLILWIIVDQTCIHSQTHIESLTQITRAESLLWISGELPFLFTWNIHFTTQ